MSALEVTLFAVLATLYLLAEEPVQNRQQQDCCLIVEVHAPDGADIQWVHAEAEIAIKQELGEGIVLKPTTEQAASKYLEADPGATHGALELATGVPLFYHLARIVSSGAPAAAPAVQSYHCLPFHALRASWWLSRTGRHLTRSDLTNSHICETKLKLRIIHPMSFEVDSKARANILLPYFITIDFGCSDGTC